MQFTELKQKTTISNKIFKMRRIASESMCDVYDEVIQGVQKERCTKI